MKNHKQNHNKLTVKQVFPHVFFPKLKQLSALEVENLRLERARKGARSPSAMALGHRGSGIPRERRSPQSEELGEKRRNVTFIRYAILCDSL